MNSCQNSHWCCFCSCWLVPLHLMHIHYIHQDFASNQRTCRQVKTCEDELRNGRKKTWLQTNKYIWWVYTFIGLHLTNFRTLSKRAGPGIIFGLLAWTDSVQRIFRRTIISEFVNRFKFSFYHTNFYILRSWTKLRKGLRGGWFCSPFNVQTILDQLVRNTEHVLWRGTVGPFTGFVTMKIFRILVPLTFGKLENIPQKYLS